MIFHISFLSGCLFVCEFKFIFSLKDHFSEASHMSGVKYFEVGTSTPSDLHPYPQFRMPLMASRDVAAGIFVYKG